MAWLRVALVIAAGCGSSGDPVARSIAATFERELGVAPRTVRCQRAACTIVLADGAAVAVTVRADGGWDTEEILDPRPIAAAIEAALADLGAPQRADCGRLRVAPAPPVTVTCRLDGGGVAWASLGPDDAIDLELAVTAAIAEARGTGPGDAALEARSRALDTDEAEGPIGEPASDDEPDAGLDPPAPRGLGG